MSKSKPPKARSKGTLIKRHKLSTRIWHWASAGCILLMLMSGLMIFNAHPRLYWGNVGAHSDPAWLEIGATETRGFLRIGGAELVTTGVLGLSAGPRGSTARRAFPQWATVPGEDNLAYARRWHLSIAWLLASGTLIFGLWSLLNGHVRHDLLPQRSELSARHILGEVSQHAIFQFPKGRDAIRYNTLQKLVYLGVSGGLIPLLILTGLTMSPWINAVMPWLMDVFGGRQSARSIHFLTAFLMVIFVLVHLIMVVAAGPINEMRSMITGWFRLPKEGRE